MNFKLSRTVVLGTLGALVLLLVLAALSYFGYRAYATVSAHAAEAEEQLLAAQAELGAYSKYSEYLPKAKQALAEQAKTLVANVGREETLSLRVQRDMQTFRADGAVNMNVVVGYVFGFELDPAKFDLTRTLQGIQLKLPAPTLVASPAVKLVAYETSTRGMVINDENAALELTRRAGEEFAAKGKAMIAQDEAIKALCEKLLVAQLRSFLEKQPGVKMLPNISISYGDKPAAAPAPAAAPVAPAPAKAAPAAAGH